MIAASAGAAAARADGPPLPRALRCLSASELGRWLLCAGLSALAPLARAAGADGELLLALAPREWRALGVEDAVPELDGELLAGAPKTTTGTARSCAVVTLPRFTSG